MGPNAPRGVWFGFPSLPGQRASDFFVLPDYPNPAKRLAGAEVSTLHSAIKQGHSLRCSPALFLKHLPAPLSALPYRRKRFKLLTPFSWS